MDRKEWNEKLKLLRQLIKREASYEEAKNMFLELHAMVHMSSVSNSIVPTFEDEVWVDLTEHAARNGLNKKGRTVLYGMWHSARIEDMTMNLLIAEQEQIIDRDNWCEKINSTIYDTGNALDKEEILAFSKGISVENLKGYRNAVANETRNIVDSLNFKDSKRGVSQTGLEKILALGAVVEDEKALWLIDFWRKKTAAGIMLMPCTRHNLVHINESMVAKNTSNKVR